MRRMLTAALALLATISTFAQPSSHTPVNKAQVDRWMTELSNWGRWGKDDQRGALNLITPAKKREAMALAKEGSGPSLRTIRRGIQVSRAISRSTTSTEG